MRIFGLESGVLKICVLVGKEALDRGLRYLVKEEGIFGYFGGRYGGNRKETLIRRFWVCDMIFFFLFGLRIFIVSVFFVDIVKG